MAERPFYHMDDLILKYFFALAEKLYVQLDQNKQTIDALMRHVGDASKSRPPRPQGTINL